MCRRDALVTFPQALPLSAWLHLSLPNAPKHCINRDGGLGRPQCWLSWEADRNDGYDGVTLNALCARAVDGKCSQRSHDLCSLLRAPHEATGLFFSHCCGGGE